MYPRAAFIRAIRASPCWGRSSLSIASLHGVSGVERGRAPGPRSGAEGEGAADGAHHEPVAQPAGERDHGLEAGAVLGHDVVQLERAERVDDAGDALLAEATQVKSADHRVDLRDSRRARRPPADPDDAAVRARR